MIIDYSTNDVHKRRLDRLELREIKRIAKLIMLEKKTQAKSKRR